MAEPLPLLVVDDDPQMVRTICDIVRVRGYTPTGATSGGDAIAATESASCTPAIALIDLRLPDMDGIELVTRLRTIAPLLEVVVLTGHASVESAVRALREDSYDYLVKPAPPDQLLSSIARAGDRWQRRRAEAALEESEARLRRMFECVSDAVFITDDSGHVLDANPAATCIAKLSLPELHGRLLDELLEPMRLSVDVRSSSFATGRIVHSVRDLSEQRRLESALRHAQKMEAVGRLAGSVAHDFNNLLVVISGFTSILIGDEGVTAENRSMLEEIQHASDRGAALTRELLAFSRKQKLNPQVIDLNRIITDMRGMLGRLMGSGIDLDMSLSPDLGRVQADPGQIEQILLNLAANARDAMSGEGRLAIASMNVVDVPLEETYGSPVPGELPRAGWVCVTVRDSGCGMTPDIIEQIFEPFFTTKEPGRGTGLGLSSVHGIVAQSGGFTRLSSAPGEGTTFLVYLPRCEIVGGVGDEKQIATAR